MQVIHVPHPTLRQVALPVTAVTHELVDFIAQLEKTLVGHRNPRGVGLSSPQVNNGWRIFSTYLSEYDEHDRELPPQIKTFINPEAISSSKEKTLGPDLRQPILEGCLSIPHLYGPVPRHEWIEYKYQVLEDGHLVTKYATFYDFEARVMQHEYDHLEGILFTDYIKEYDLPLYDDARGKMRLVTDTAVLSSI